MNGYSLFGIAAGVSVWCGAGFILSVRACMRQTGILTVDDVLISAIFSLLMGPFLPLTMWAISPDEHVVWRGRMRDIKSEPRREARNRVECWREDRVEMLV